MEGRPVGPNYTHDTIAWIRGNGGKANFLDGGAIMLIQPGGTDQTANVGDTIVLTDDGKFVIWRGDSSNLQDDDEAAEVVELEAKLHCINCGKVPDEIGEYQPESTGTTLAPRAYVIAEEGTLNRANGHFYCTSCYITVGMPLGVAP